MPFTRMHSEYQAAVNAPVSDVWDLLTDWPGILRWWPSSGPVPMTHAEPVEGPYPGRPTRLIRVTGGPDALETLLLADPVAYRIYYTLADGGIPIIRNYVASTALDAHGEAGCMMSFSSHYDVVPGVEPSQAEAFVLGIYEIIAQGFSQYFSNRAAG